MGIRILWSLAALVVPCAALPAQTPAAIHVAVDGLDAADGSAAHPVRSLTRAQELVRASRADGGSVEVVLHRGTWRVPEPLRFRPSDGGDRDHAVTWRADGPVTISGGRQITGWQVGPDGAWRTTVPTGWHFRELFVDGARRPRARHPNDGYLRVVKAADDRRTGFSFAPGDLPAIDDLAPVELVFLHDWSISRVGVAAIDVAASALRTTDPIGGAAPHYAIDNFEPHPRWFVENSAAFLDQPGEWFLDRSTAALAYLPMPGESPDDVAVIAPVVERHLVVVEGDAERRIENLHFVGIDFAHCAWQIPAHGYAEGQANYHEPRTAESGILREIVPAAVSFERAFGCSVRGGSVRHVGTGGVWFGSRTTACKLEGTVVDDVSSNGVLIGEDQNRQIDGRPWWQADADQIAQFDVVRDCTISRCGQQFSGAVGIWVGFARNAYVIHNELRDLPYTGVSVGWIWDPTPTPCGYHQVLDNHIHHVMQVLSDGGGIYTLGRQPGTVLARNRIHDIHVNLGRAESNGMFLDEGTTDIVIEDNQIWNVDRSPLRFHRATTNLVRGNLLVLRGDAPPIRYNTTRPEDIAQDANVVAREVDGK